MKIFTSRARRLLQAALLSCACVSAAVVAPAQARGVSGIDTDYPVALSVQIDPATITDADLNEIRAAGFEFVRFGVRPPLKSVNPNLIDYPRLIKRVRNAKLDAIVTLFGGSAIWGLGPKDWREGARKESLFSDFAVDFMKAHTGDVAVWEVWNEPDHKTFLNPALLADFETASSELCANMARQKVQPNIVVGFGFANLPFVGGKVPAQLENAFVSAAKSDCLTDISIHPYRPVPETAFADYEKLRAQLDKRDLKKTGIAISEWGYASYLPVRSQSTQASLVFREYLINAAAGIKLLNLYAWRDRGRSSFSKEDNFGIMSNAGEKKEAFSALTEFLKIARHSKKVSYDDAKGVNQLVLKRDDALLHVLWTQASEKDVTVPVAEGKKCTRVDFFPQARRGSCGPRTGGGFSAKASAYPVLLSISD
ncbi:hypothetical protein RT97_31215 [Variovorax paradoxus]|uniref:Glycoside hydrolase family 5 domain-containing protein n=1 Tax=Variovorax paradoxus TaxID=34073 RepID=A0A0D0L8J3_VARPD|nr:hypothetical protein [Variovorax paradoxus]KIQ16326.1 hypothetical protein RT97_31215 [Variovorax paradoxus]